MDSKMLAPKGPESPPKSVRVERTGWTTQGFLPCSRPLQMLIFSAGLFALAGLWSQVAGTRSAQAENNPAGATSSAKTSGSTGSGASTNVVTAAATSSSSGVNSSSSGVNSASTVGTGTGNSGAGGTNASSKPKNTGSTPPKKAETPRSPYLFGDPKQKSANTSPPRPALDAIRQAMGGNANTTPFENFRESLQAAPELLEQRQLENDFVAWGMRPRPKNPTREIKDVEKVLGPVPRFADHTFYSEGFQSLLDIRTDSRLTAGNSIQLLPDREAWAARKRVMQDARETLYVTTMLMICDEGGREFSQLMIDAARRGVDTRFILDALFSLYANPCLNMMRQGGVEVILSLRSIRPDKIDWESHEKILVADGEVAITGGTNVGSWYQDSDGFDENYRDTDVMLEGPIVIDLARRFVTLWTSLRRDDHSLDGYLEELETKELTFAHQRLLGRQHYARWLSPSNRNGLCRFVAQDPHLNTFHVWSLYQELIEESRKRVMLTAYALDPLGSPNQVRMQKALIKLASKPDAKVDLITNGYGGLYNPVVPPLFRNSYSASVLRQSWRGFGNTPVRLNVYHYFIHAKQYYFDGILGAVGSFNYDNSGNRCQESTVVCMDPTFLSELERLFARDIANSWVLSGEDIARIERDQSARKKGKNKR